MSFQAYLDNIQSKTGQSPDDLQAQAIDKGLADDAGWRRGSRQVRLSTG